MVTVFGILNLTEDSFFDESRRLDPAGAVTAAIEMLRVGSDVVDVGPAASHPDARPVSPADEIRRIAPLLDALSDQMHRVSIDSFQPETQRYALKRGVGYLNDIQGFPDPALYPDIAEADCRLVVMHSAQRDGIATRTGHLRPEDALDEIVRFFEARVSALRRSGVAADRLILDPGMGFFLSPAPETSLHVLSNLQKLKSALGLPLLVSVSRKSFLGATVGLPVKDLGPASLAAELHAIGNGADYVRTHAPGDLRSAITFSETLAKFRSRDARASRVRSCLAFTFRPPASGPWSGSAKVGADMLGSSGSNCTMRRRFIPRQGSEWTARSLRTFGSPARVISTRLCG